MKHSLLLALILLYMVALGQNWGEYAGALMVCAVIKDWQVRRARIQET